LTQSKKGCLLLATPATALVRMLRGVHVSSSNHRFPMQKVVHSKCICPPARCPDTLRPGAVPSGPSPS
jgi:hypothetical protein